jgi:ribose transport system ATP-binding protein
MGTQTVLEAVEVSKEFLGVRALDKVSFSLRPGEVHALVGENGAGKSTLIKVLTGVYQPDGGEVRHRGDPVRFAHPNSAQQAGICTIYQEVNLIPLMSVASNVFLDREPRTRFGLPRRQNCFPGTASPGTSASRSAAWPSARSRWWRWPGRSRPRRTW